MQEIRNVDLRSFNQEDREVKKLQTSIDNKENKEDNFFYNEVQTSFIKIEEASKVQSQNLQL
jgi:hypothetical protein